MQSSQVRNVAKQNTCQAPGLFSDDQAQLWLARDPRLLVHDWFLADESQIVRSTRDYISKLTKWRNCKNERVADFLKSTLKKIMFSLQLHVNNLGQKLLSSELEEELIHLTSFYMDMELRVWPVSLKKLRSSAPGGCTVVTQRMVDRLLHWLYTMLPTTAARVDALLSLIMVYHEESRVLLDPVFRKVLSELETGPLTDVSYVRNMLFYKLWDKKVRVNSDRESVSLRAKIVQSLRPANPYVTFSDELRACLPYVRKECRNVPEFHLDSSIYLKKSCADFIKCRRYFGCLDVNIGNINICDGPLDFFEEEKDEVTDLMDMLDNIQVKKSENIISIDLTADSDPTTSSCMHVVDLTIDDEKPHLEEDDCVIVPDNGTPNRICSGEPWKRELEGQAVRRRLESGDHTYMRRQAEKHRLKEDAKTVDNKTVPLCEDDMSDSSGDTMDDRLGRRYNRETPSTSGLNSNFYLYPESDYENSQPEMFGMSSGSSNLDNFNSRDSEYSGECSPFIESPQVLNEDEMEDEVVSEMFRGGLKLRQSDPRYSAINRTCSSGSSDSDNREKVSRIRAIPIETLQQTKFINTSPSSSKEQLQTDEIILDSSVEERLPLHKNGSSNIKTSHVSDKILNNTSNVDISNLDTSAPLDNRLPSEEGNQVQDLPTIPTVECTEQNQVTEPVKDRSDPTSKVPDNDQSPKTPEDDVQVTPPDNNKSCEKVPQVQLEAVTKSKTLLGDLEEPATDVTSGDAPQVLDKIDEVHEPVLAILNEETVDEENDVEKLVNDVSSGDVPQVPEKIEEVPVQVLQISNEETVDKESDLQKPDNDVPCEDVPQVPEKNIKVTEEVLQISNEETVNKEIDLEKPANDVTCEDDPQVPEKNKELPEEVLQISNEETVDKDNDLEKPVNDVSSEDVPQVPEKNEEVPEEVLQTSNKKTVDKENNLEKPVNDVTTEDALQVPGKNKEVAEEVLQISNETIDKENDLEKIVNDVTTKDAPHVPEKNKELPEEVLQILDEEAIDKENDLEKLADDIITEDASQVPEKNKELSEEVLQISDEETIDKENDLEKLVDDITTEDAPQVPEKNKEVAEEVLQISNAETVDEGNESEELANDVTSRDAPKIPQINEEIPEQVLQISDEENVSEELANDVISGYAPQVPQINEEVPEQVLQISTKETVDNENDLKEVAIAVTSRDAAQVPAIVETQSMHETPEKDAEVLCGKVYPEESSSVQPTPSLSRIYFDESAIEKDLERLAQEERTKKPTYDADPFVQFRHTDINVPLAMQKPQGIVSKKYCAEDIAILKIVSFINEDSLSDEDDDDVLPDDGFHLLDSNQSTDEPSNYSPSSSGSLPRQSQDKSSNTQIEPQDSEESPENSPEQPAEDAPTVNFQEVANSEMTAGEVHEDSTEEISTNKTDEKLDGQLEADNKVDDVTKKEQSQIKKKTTDEELVDDLAAEENPLTVDKTTDKVDEETEKQSAEEEPQTVEETTDKVDDKAEKESVEEEPQVDHLEVEGILRKVQETTDNNVDEKENVSCEEEPQVVNKTINVEELVHLTVEENPLGDETKDNNVCDETQKQSSEEALQVINKTADVEEVVDHLETEEDLLKNQEIRDGVDGETEKQSFEVTPRMTNKITDIEESVDHLEAEEDLLKDQEIGDNVNNETEKQSFEEAPQIINKTTDVEELVDHLEAEDNPIKVGEITDNNVAEKTESAIINGDNSESRSLSEDDSEATYEDIVTVEILPEKQSVEGNTQLINKTSDVVVHLEAEGRLIKDETTADKNVDENEKETFENDPQVVNKITDVEELIQLTAEESQSEDESTTHKNVNEKEKESFEGDLQVVNKTTNVEELLGDETRDNNVDEKDNESFEEVYQVVDKITDVEEVVELQAEEDPLKVEETTDNNVDEKTESVEVVPQVDKFVNTQESESRPLSEDDSDATYEDIVTVEILTSETDTSEEFQEKEPQIIEEVTKEHTETLPEIEFHDSKDIKNNATIDTEEKIEEVSSKIVSIEDKFSAKNDAIEEIFQITVEDLEANETDENNKLNAEELIDELKKTIEEADSQKEVSELEKERRLFILCERMDFAKYFKEKQKPVYNLRNTRKKSKYPMKKGRKVNKRDTTKRENLEEEQKLITEQLNELKNDSDIVLVKRKAKDNFNYEDEINFLLIPEKQTDSNFEDPKRQSPVSKNIFPCIIVPKNNRKLRGIRNDKVTLAKLRRKAKTKVLNTERFNDDTEINLLQKKPEEATTVLKVEDTLLPLDRLESIIGTALEEYTRQRTTESTVSQQNILVEEKTKESSVDKVETEEPRSVPEYSGTLENIEIKSGPLETSANVVQFIEKTIETIENPLANVEFETKDTQFNEETTKTNNLLVDMENMNLNKAAEVSEPFSNDKPEETPVSEVEPVVDQKCYVLLENLVISKQDCSEQSVPDDKNVNIPNKAIIEPSLIAQNSQVPEPVNAAVDSEPVPKYLEHISQELTEDIIPEETEDLPDHDISTLIQPPATLSMVVSEEYTCGLIPPLPIEPYIHKEYYEIGHARLGMAKCCVNGIAKINKLPNVIQDSCSKTLRDCFTETFTELNVETFEECSAIETTEENNCTAEQITHKVQPPPSKIKPAVPKLTDEDYNFNMLATICSTLVLQVPSENADGDISELPNDKPDKPSSVLEDKIQVLKNKKTVHDMLSSLEDVLNCAQEPEITIPNTTHLQLSPDDFDYGFPPVVRSNSYSLETGVAKDFYTETVHVQVQKPTYGEKSKPKNDFTDIFNLANLDKEAERNLGIEETTEKKEDKRNKVKKEETVTKEQVKGLLNKYKKAEEKQKSNKQEATSSSPFGYIRSTRPTRMTTRRKQNSSFEESPKKSNTDELFDQLLAEHKQELSSKKLNKSLDANCSFESTLSDDLPLIYHVKKPQDMGSRTDNDDVCLADRIKQKPETINPTDTDTLVRAIVLETAEKMKEEDLKLKKQNIKNNLRSAKNTDLRKNKTELEDDRQLRKIDKPMNKIDNRTLNKPIERGKKSKKDVKLESLPDLSDISESDNTRKNKYTKKNKFVEMIAKENLILEKITSDPIKPKISEKYTRKTKSLLEVVAQITDNKIKELKPECSQTVPETIKIQPEEISQVPKEKPAKIIPKKRKLPDELISEIIGEKLDITVEKQVDQTPKREEEVVDKPIIRKNEISKETTGEKQIDEVLEDVEKINITKNESAVEKQINETPQEEKNVEKMVTRKNDKSKELSVQKQVDETPKEEKNFEKMITRKNYKSKASSIEKQVETPQEGNVEKIKIGKSEKSIESAVEKQIDETPKTLENIEKINSSKNEKSKESASEKQVDETPQEQNNVGKVKTGKSVKSKETAVEKQIDETPKTLEKIEKINSRKNEKSKESAIQKQVDETQQEENNVEKIKTGKSEKSKELAVEKQIDETPKILEKIEKSNSRKNEKSTIQKQVDEIPKVQKNGEKIKTIKIEKPKECIVKKQVDEIPKEEKNVEKIKTKKIGNPKESTIEKQIDETPKEENNIEKIKSRKNEEPKESTIEMQIDETPKEENNIEKIKGRKNEKLKESTVDILIDETSKIQENIEKIKTRKNEKSKESTIEKQFNEKPQEEMNVEKIKTRKNEKFKEPIVEKKVDEIPMVEEEVKTRKTDKFKESAIQEQADETPQEEKIVEKIKTRKNDKSKDLTVEKNIDETPKKQKNAGKIKTRNNEKLKESAIEKQIDETSKVQENVEKIKTRKNDKSAIQKQVDETPQEEKNVAKPKTRKSERCREIFEVLKENVKATKKKRIEEKCKNLAQEKLGNPEIKEQTSTVKEIAFNDSEIEKTTESRIAVETDIIECPKTPDVQIDIENQEKIEIKPESYDTIKQNQVESPDTMLPVSMLSPSPNAVVEKWFNNANNQIQSSPELSIEPPSSIEECQFFEEMSNSSDTSHNTSGNKSKTYTEYQTPDSGIAFDEDSNKDKPSYPNTDQENFTDNELYYPKLSDVFLEHSMMEQEVEITTKPLIVEERTALLVSIKLDRLTEVLPMLKKHKPKEIEAYLKMKSEAEIGDNNRKKLKRKLRSPLKISDEKRRRTSLEISLKSPVQPAETSSPIEAMVCEEVCSPTEPKIDSVEPTVCDSPKEPECQDKSQLVLELPDKSPVHVKKCQKVESDCTLPVKNLVHVTESPIRTEECQDLSESVHTDKSPVLMEVCEEKSEPVLSDKSPVLVEECKKSEFVSELPNVSPVYLEKCQENSEFVPKSSNKSPDLLDVCQENVVKSSSVSKPIESPVDLEECKENPEQDLKSRESPVSMEVCKENLNSAFKSSKKSPVHTEENFDKSNSNTKSNENPVLLEDQGNSVFKLPMKSPVHLEEKSVSKLSKKSPVYLEEKSVSKLPKESPVHLEEKSVSKLSKKSPVYLEEKSVSKLPKESPVHLEEKSVSKLSKKSPVHLEEKLVSKLPKESPVHLEEKSVSKLSKKSPVHLEEKLASKLPKESPVHLEEKSVSKLPKESPVLLEDHLKKSDSDSKLSKESPILLEKYDEKLDSKLCKESPVLTKKYLETKSDFLPEENTVLLEECEEKLESISKLPPNIVFSENRTEKSDSYFKLSKESPVLVKCHEKLVSKLSVESPILVPNENTKEFQEKTDLKSSSPVVESPQKNKTCHDMPCIPIEPTCEEVPDSPKETKTTEKGTVVANKKRSMSAITNQEIPSVSLEVTAESKTQEILEISECEEISSVSSADTKIEEITDDTVVTSEPQISCDTPVLTDCQEVIYSSPTHCTDIYSSPVESECIQAYSPEEQDLCSPVESTECLVEWSEEVVSPASNQPDLACSTPEEELSRDSKKDYPDCLFGITNSPVPSTSCCMNSPYPSDISHPEEQAFTLCEEGGIDLCTDYYKYYDSIESMKEQSLQAGYCVVDSQFTVMYEHLNDEDLFSNMMGKNMVTVKMSEIQPEIKHPDEEKRSEFEEFEDNNISGVVDGICRNLDSDIVIDQYSQAEVNTLIEEIDPQVIENFDTSEESISELLEEIPVQNEVFPAKIPNADVVQKDKSQTINKTTHLEKKTETKILQPRQRKISETVKTPNIPIISPVRERKISETNIPTVVQDVEKKLSPEKKGTERKVPIITKIKSPRVEVKKPEQEVPKKDVKDLVKPSFSYRAMTPKRKSESEVKNEVKNEIQNSPKPKIESKETPKTYSRMAPRIEVKPKLEVAKKEVIKIEPKKEKYESPKKMEPTTSDGKTSKAEELFDLVKKSTLDDVRDVKPTYSFGKMGYIHRTAFKNASKKITEEYQPSRKRKCDDKPSTNGFKRRTDERTYEKRPNGYDNKMYQEQEVPRKYEEKPGYSYKRKSEDYRNYESSRKMPRMDGSRSNYKEYSRSERKPSPYIDKQHQSKRPTSSTWDRYGNYREPMYQLQKLEFSAPPAVAPKPKEKKERPGGDTWLQNPDLVATLERAKVILNKQWTGCN